MRIPLTYKETPLLGLDLGTKSVKIVQLKPGRGGEMKVLAYGSAAYPSDVIVEGIIVDPKPIAAAIKPILNSATQGKFSAKRAVMSLPTEMVFVRVIDLPPMAREELDSAVQLEAEQYVPVPVNHLYIDYEIISRAPDNQVVLMVAAPSAIVDSYMKLLELLDLEPALMEPDIMAVTRALTPAVPADQAVVVADIESSATHLAVYDRALRITNTIGVGGDAITERLAKELGLPADKANEIKIKFGLGESGIRPKIEEALKPTVTSFSQELGKVVRYYSDHGGERPVQSVLLAGGTSQMPGLAAHLAEVLKLNVTVPNA
jgi:type IV pilus assembly protein PilM